ncbi:MAG: DUF4870 domain-containing protein [Chloroflexi bacterium]|nr:DUF4870 domain-containing protein [Chloroflexota bacterium]
MRRYNRPQIERTWAGLAHLSIALVVVLLAMGFGAFGLFITLFIYFFTRRFSPWMAFQAMQALAVQSLVLMAVLIKAVLPPPGEGNQMATPQYWLDVFVLIVFIFAVTGAVRCFMDYGFRYPIIGPFIQRRLGVSEE